MAPTTTPPVAPATIVASDKNTPAAVVQSSSVTVHPLVLLSVVDHYNRVAKNTKKRALGVLLGQAHGNKVNVANSFAGKKDGKRPLFLLIQGFCPWLRMLLTLAFLETDACILISRSVNLP